MFFPEGRIRVFLYGQPVDMRKSYDGLYALASAWQASNESNVRPFARPPVPAPAGSDQGTANGEPPPNAASVLSAFSQRLPPSPSANSSAIAL